MSRGLPSGVVNYFAVTAYDVSGREGGFSNELSLLVTVTPTPTSTVLTALQSRTSTASASATQTPTVTRTATRVPTIVPTSTTTVTPSRTAVSGPAFDVTGRIDYYTGSGPVADAVLTLQDAQGALITTTDGLGRFEFAAVAPGSWRLEPQKDRDVQYAVSALDAAYILQAVSGLRDLDPLALLACDVTGDGTLSALDATRILQLAVGQIERLPIAQTCGSDWVFLPQPLAVPQQRLVLPESSETSCQHGAISFEPLQGNAVQQDFAAVLFGDCTGNWQAAGLGAARRFRIGAAQAGLGTPQRRRGDRWLVPLYIQGGDMVEALTAHIAYDPAEVELQAVRPADTAAGALVRYRADDSGTAALVLASARPLTIGRRSLAILVFRAATAPQVLLLDAVIDEVAALVAD